MKYHYDGDVDIFVLNKQSKVKHSVEVGDFVIDFDKNNLVVGIEVLDASEHLGKLDFLEDASMSVVYKPRNVYITLSLLLNGKEKDVTIPISRPAALAN